jgi:hypothetical protein
VAACTRTQACTVSYSLRFTTQRVPDRRERDALRHIGDAGPPAFGWCGSFGRSPAGAQFGSESSGRLGASWLRGLDSQQAVRPSDDEPVRGRNRASGSQNLYLKGEAAREGAGTLVRCGHLGRLAGDRCADRARPSGGSMRFCTPSLAGASLGRHSLGWA